MLKLKTAFALCFISLTMAGCGNSTSGGGNDDKSQQASASSVENAAPVAGEAKSSTTNTASSDASIADILPDPPSVTSPPPPPPHFYSMRENELYGYERALSDEDRTQGVEAAPLQMIRYLGQYKGQFLAEQMLSGNVLLRLQCEAPCDFLHTTMYNMFGGVQSTVTRDVPGTIGWSIMQDAMNGYLKSSTSPYENIFPTGIPVPDVHASGPQGGTSTNPLSASNALSTQPNPSVAPATQSSIPTRVTPNLPYKPSRYETSFDCSIATAADEIAVCGDAGLAAMDIELAAAYKADYSANVNPDNLISSEQTWLKQRYECGSEKDCLRSVYGVRINQLEHWQTTN